MKTISKEKAIRILSLNILIIFLVSSLLAFYIDGFLRHPIPRQQDGELFDLSKIDTQYADAIVLDESHAISQFGDVFLVQWQQETHLLYYKHHFQTGRHRLVSDVIVDTDSSQTVKIGTSLEQVVVNVGNGEIENLSTGPMSTAFYNSIYLLIGMVVTVGEAVAFWWILKRKIKE